MTARRRGSSRRDERGVQSELGRNSHQVIRRAAPPAHRGLLRTWHAPEFRGPARRTDFALLRAEFVGRSVVGAACARTSSPRSLAALIQRHGCSAGSPRFMSSATEASDPTAPRKGAAREALHRAHALIDRTQQSEPTGGRDLPAVETHAHVTTTRDLESELGSRTRCLHRRSRGVVEENRVVTPLCRTSWVG